MKTFFYVISAVVSFSLVGCGDQTGTTKRSAANAEQATAELELNASGYLSSADAEATPIFLKLGIGRFAAADRFAFRADNNGFSDVLLGAGGSYTDIVRTFGQQFVRVTDTNDCIAGVTNLKRPKILINPHNKAIEYLTLNSAEADGLEAAGWSLVVSPYMGCLYVNADGNSQGFTPRQIAHWYNATTGNRLYFDTTDAAQVADAFRIISQHSGKWQRQVPLGYFQAPNPAHEVVRKLFSEYIGRSASPGELNYHGNRVSQKFKELSHKYPHLSASQTYNLAYNAFRSEWYHSAEGNYFTGILNQIYAVSECKTRAKAVIIAPLAMSIPNGFDRVSRIRQVCVSLAQFDDSSALNGAVQKVIDGNGIHHYFLSDRTGVYCWIPTFAFTVPALYTDGTTAMTLAQMLNGNVHISKLGETISVSNFVGTCKSGTQTHEVFGL